MANEGPLDIIVAAFDTEGGAVGRITRAADIARRLREQSEAWPRS